MFRAGFFSAAGESTHLNREIIRQALLLHLATQTILLTFLRNIAQNDSLEVPSWPVIPAPV